jgi:pSer/pThr/pTyr-binding forkhead associated (FHA) protein
MAFVLHHGEQAVRIPNGRSVIGRAEGCIVRLRGESASRRHAELELSSTGLFIEELNRRTGVEVNGQRVEGRRRLEHGDRISIDGEEIVVEAQLPRVDVRLPRSPALEELRAEPVTPEVTTVSGLGFAVHRAGVARLLAENEVEAAAEVVISDMTALILLYTRGKRVAVEDLDGTARCGLDLAARSGEARWLDNVFRLYARARAPIPTKLFTLLVATVPSVGPLSSEALQSYLDVARELRGASSLVSGLEALLPLAR